jgi:hypothetical protein
MATERQQKRHPISPPGHSRRRSRIADRSRGKQHPNRDATIMFVDPDKNLQSALVSALHFTSFSLTDLFNPNFLAAVS